MSAFAWLVALATWAALEAVATVEREEGSVWWALPIYSAVGTNALAMLVAAVTVAYAGAWGNVFITGAVGGSLALLAVKLTVGYLKRRKR